MKQIILNVIDVVKSGEITVDDMVAEFKKQLENTFNSL